MAKSKRSQVQTKSSVRSVAVLSVLLSTSLFTTPAQAAQEKSVLDKIMEYILPESLYPPAKPSPAPVKRPARGQTPNVARPVPARPAAARAAVVNRPPPAPAATPAISISQMADELTAKFNADATISKSDRKLLQQFYADRNFTPVWFEPNPSPGKADPILRMNEKAASLRQSIVELNNHGLRAAQYWSAEAENAKSAPTEGWTTGELLYSRALIRSAIDISVGRLDPMKVNSDIKIAKKPFTGWALLREITTGPIFLSPWDQLAPQIPAYARLHDALKRLREIHAKGGFAALVPSKTILKFGSSSETVREMKVRAQAMGYKIGTIDSSFDQDLETAVEDIQKANLLKPSGIVKPTDTATWAFFKPSSQDRIQEMQITMEKLRWLPNQLESRHIFINLATQRLNLVDPNNTMESLKDMKVIVGKATAQTRTPTFRNQMTYVVMNPTWSVPSSIFFRSKIEMLRKLSSEQGQYAVDNWFYQNGFQILYTQGGQKYTAQPSQINWFAPNEAFVNSVTLRQNPRYDNALGVVKFLLDNNYSIWLHDTNERHLFANDARMLSSGCIRLENPKDLAEYLLTPKGYSRSKLESILVKPGQMDAKEAWVNMSNEKLPVYTMALTANAGDDGILRFTRDLYLQNDDVLKALKLAGF